MDFTNLKGFLDKMVKEYNTPGVDCIVYKEHEEIFRYYTGMRDIENNIKTDGNELYIIFSMTKMLTCTCALQLFEQGKYLMSDPVSRYLPEFENMRVASSYTDNGADVAQGKATDGQNKTAAGCAKKPITIKDLFTMSAGLDYNIDAPYIKEAVAQGKTSTREIVASLSNTVLSFEPGTKFQYSLCHDVLGALIEVWSGKSLGEYMKDHLFTPLGMKDTFFGVPKDKERLSRMAVRYTYDENRLPERLPLECHYQLSADYESGGAGLTSSAEDYALFLDALANGGIGKNGNRILSPATVELMGTNHLTGTRSRDFYPLREGYGYGLGVRVHTDKADSGSLSPIGEFGWDGAAGAFSLVDTKNKLSLTYFQEIHNWDLRYQTELKNALYSCLN